MLHHLIIFSVRDCTCSPGFVCIPLHSQPVSTSHHGEIVNTFTPNIDQCEHRISPPNLAHYTADTLEMGSTSATQGSCMQLYSPDGTPYRVFVANGGTLTSEAGACSE